MSELGKKLIAAAREGVAIARERNHYVEPRCGICGSRGMERYCSRCEGGTAPNRLYGVEINHEGDAI